MIVSKMYKLSPDFRYSQKSHHKQTCYREQRRSANAFIVNCIAIRILQYVYLVYIHKFRYRNKLIHCEWPIDRIHPSCRLFGIYGRNTPNVATGVRFHGWFQSWSSETWIHWTTNSGLHLLKSKACSFRHTNVATQSRWILRSKSSQTHFVHAGRQMMALCKNMLLKCSLFIVNNNQ